MAEWRTQPDGKWVIRMKHILFDRSWSEPARNNWVKMSDALLHLDVRWFSLGSPDLLLPREQRQSHAQSTIRQMAAISHLAPSSTLSPEQTPLWASDGSMVPPSAGMFDPKSVTAAITGPKTLVLKIDSRNISILHGELMGLIMGLILSNPHSAGSLLYTDHLNSVRLIDDSKTAIDQRPRLRGMNGRSYYRWILSLTSTNPLSIAYTPGHTDEVSVPARLNFEADHYASLAQRHARQV